MKGENRFFRPIGQFLEPTFRKLLSVKRHNKSPTLVCSLANGTKFDCWWRLVGEFGMKFGRVRFSVGMGFVWNWAISVPNHAYELCQQP